MTDHDLRAWEIAPRTAFGGMSVIWALVPDGEPVAVAMATTQECAEQIVAEHALVTTPYHDNEHRGGSWVAMLSGLQAEIMRLRRLLEHHSILHDQDM